MTLLVAGVLISGWTIRIAAASYNVNGKVPAPPLTEGAVITSPSDGSVSKVSPITVAGTCPNDSYVKLYRNSAFSGAAWCAANTFSIDTSLSVGVNTLQAQDYNITDDPGPITPSISVTYAPPVPPKPPSGSGSSSASGGSSSEQTTPLSVSSEYRFRGFNPGDTVEWSLAVNGGTRPYNIRVAWGDNKQSRMPVARAGSFTVSHVYTSSGYYVIKVYATDSSGGSAMIQLIAYVRDLAAGGTLSQSGPFLPSGLSGLEALFDGANRWLWLAWPTYITVTLMVVSFWLGERQSIRVAVEQAARKRARAYHHS